MRKICISIILILCILSFTGCEEQMPQKEIIQTETKVELAEQNNLEGDNYNDNIQDSQKALAQDKPVIIEQDEVNAIVQDNSADQKRIEKLMLQDIHEKQEANMLLRTIAEGIEDVKLSIYDLRQEELQKNNEHIGDELKLATTTDKNFEKLDNIERMVGDISENVMKAVNKPSHEDYSTHVVNYYTISDNKPAEREPEGETEDPDDGKTDDPDDGNDGGQEDGKDEDEKQDIVLNDERSYVPGEPVTISIASNTSFAFSVSLFEEPFILQFPEEVGLSTLNVYLYSGLDRTGEIPLERDNNKFNSTEEVDGTYYVEIEGLPLGVYQVNVCYDL